MAIKVIKAGLATSVQDLGRSGYFHLGIPLSGAMDRLALRAANLLVGNDEGTACLEAVFIGPEIEFTSDVTIAVTGGDMPLKIDGEDQPGWTALKVRGGQVLSFGFLKSGARIYIAFSGGVDVPLVLGSRSTYALGALGGFKGRLLAAGDVVSLGDPGSDVEIRTLSENLRRKPANPVELRVLPGLYWHRLRDESKVSFFDDGWKVSPEADRIGYRFRGGRVLSLVEHERPFGAGSDPSNIVDGCYPYGSIQVPGGTEPIILHRDAVSAGGYFTVGTVISADMDLIGQMQPNTPTRFVMVDMDEALNARFERSRLIQEIRTALS